MRCEWAITRIIESRNSKRIKFAYVVKDLIWLQQILQYKVV